MKLECKVNKEINAWDISINDIFFDDIFIENYPTIMKKITKYISNLDTNNPIFFKGFLKELLGLIIIYYGEKENNSYKIKF